MPEIEIRDKPKLRSFSRNITEMTFTSFVWGIWLYLLLPVVNIIMWILGFKFIKISVIEQVGYKEFFDLMSKMGWTVLIVFLILRVWGYYNYHRFGKRGRRKESPPVTIEQLAEHYRIPVHEIMTMQGQKEIDWPYVR
jgi:poly-beta-1,6-N-acetyl-D-glucosamine biosynthesis protein PgaD